MRRHQGSDGEKEENSLQAVLAGDRLRPVLSAVGIPRVDGLVRVGDVGKKLANGVAARRVGAPLAEGEAAVAIRVVLARAGRAGQGSGGE